MLPLFAHIPVIYVTNPAEDWCTVIDNTLGGDIVMLEPGTYSGTCDITARQPQEPQEHTIIQSFDPDNLAVIQAGEDGGPALRVTGERLVLLQLILQGTSEAPVIEIDEFDDIVLRWLEIDAQGGPAVRQTSLINELVVESTTISNFSTGLDLDCEDCTLLDLRVHNSVFTDGSDAVSAVADTLSLSNLFISSLDGVGLRARSPFTEIGGVFVQGAPAVDVDSGRIVNSFLVAEDQALQLAPASTVELLGSTVRGRVAEEPGLRVTSSALDALPSSVTDGGGNVLCADPTLCWSDADAWDFTPVVQGPLVGAGQASPDLEEDWCGNERSAPPTAGALEADAATPGALVPGIPDLIRCESDDDGETPDDSDRGSAPDETEPPATASSSGCSHGGGASSALSLLALLGWLSRRGRAYPHRRGRDGASHSR